MGRMLNLTGRSIVYSCSWPAYLINQPEKVMNFFISILKLEIFFKRVINWIISEISQREEIMEYSNGSHLSF